MKNLLLNIFLTSCLLLSLSTLKTKAQCTSVSQGFATADCSTGEIQVNAAALFVDPSCLAAFGGFSSDILTAADDDGTLIFDNITSMLMGAPIPFFPGGTHYPNGTGTVGLMVFSNYFNFFGSVGTTDWWDVGPDAIQGTIDDTYAGTTVDPMPYMIFQTTPIIVKFTPGCADPTMPSINGTELATLPVIPCNTQPDATFTVDNLGPVLPGQVVNVTSVAADPNGGAYVLSQTTDLVVGDVYSDCASLSIINTAQYTGMTGDACVQSYQIDIAVLPFPTNGPIIDDYTCIDQIPGITDPTNADGFIWVYEPGATNVYDNCASVDVSGHWTTPDGCDGPIIAGATNPQRCPFPTDNPTVTDNICPDNTNGLFAPPADDPLGNFAWVWDVSNPPTYDACLGAQTASGYWEDTECTSLTDPRSVTSSPTQCCPVITNVSGAEVICHNNSATLLSPVTVDDATLLGFGGADWYIGGAPDAGGQVYDAASTELNTSCSIVDVVLTSYAQCACSGVWIAGATYTITVNPAPPIVNPIPGSCGVAASVELICADGVTVLDTKTHTSSPNGLPCAASGTESDPLAAGSWTAAEIETLLGATGSGCYSDATFAEVAADCAYQACCPTVTTAASGTSTICHNDAAPSFPTITLSSGTLGVDYTITWSPASIANTNSTCAAVTTTYTPTITCLADNSVITGGGSFDVTVYPNVANFTVTVTPPIVCGASPTVVVGSCATMTTNAVTTAAVAGCSSDVPTANDPVNGVYTHIQAAHPTFVGAPACFVLPTLVTGTTAITACESCGACPTVTTAASGTSTICHNDAAPSFPTITLSSGTLGVDYTITWSPASIANTNSTCAAVTTTYTPTITCLADNSVITGGGSFDVTVYPDPTNFTVVTTTGVCGSAPTAILELLDGTDCDVQTGAMPNCVVATPFNYSFTINSGQTCQNILSGVVASACSDCSTFGISDPCSCNNDATVAANDGTFEETVAVWNDLNGDGILDAGESSAAGETWTVVAQTGASGVTAGTTTLTYGVIPGPDNPNGISGYYVTFNHVDAVGYTMSVEGPATLGTGGNITLSKANTCTYPNPSLSVVGSPFCSTAAAVTLAGTTPNGANTAATPYSGTGVTGSQFNPATAGVGGPYTITYSYDPAGDANNQCLQPTTTSVSVVTCPVCGASPNMQWGN